MSGQHTNLKDTIMEGLILEEYKSFPYELEIWNPKLYVILFNKALLVVL